MADSRADARSRAETRTSGIRLEPGRRRAYDPPALVVYGSLRTLTGLTGNLDFDGFAGSRVAT